MESAAVAALGDGVGAVTAAGAAILAILGVVALLKAMKRAF